MVRAQILRYISRPKYTRQSPDCPLVIFSFTALPSCLHCSTQYSSASAQHCIVAPPPLSISCTRVHPHCVYPPRVSPSAPVSLLQVRPLPPISSESQQLRHLRTRTTSGHQSPTTLETTSSGYRKASSSSNGPCKPHVLEESQISQSPSGKTVRDSSRLQSSD